jgi:hypothetical protein
MSTSHLEVVDSAHSDARVLPYKYKFLQHVYILFEQLIPTIIYEWCEGYYNFLLKVIFNYKPMWQYIINEMIN